MQYVVVFLEALLVSYMTTKIMAIDYFKTIDGYVKDCYEMMKSVVETAITVIRKERP